MNIETSGGIIIHSNDKIHTVDDNFCNLIGVESSNDIQGKSINDYILDDYKNLFHKQVNDLKTTEDKLGLQIKLKTVNDEEVTVIAVSSFLESEHKSEIKTLFINISETDTGWLNSLKNNAMNKAPVGITIADITLDDEPLIYVNDGFIDITGYERRDTIGQNCRFLQGKDTRDKPTSKMRNAINNEETVTVEIQNYKKDGSKFWNRITLGPIYDENNELTHYIGFQEDISNLKKHKKEKNVFEKYVEASEQSMLVTDTDWNIEYINQSFEDLTKYSEEELIGEKITIIEPDESNISQYDKFDLNMGWNGEIIYRKKHGELYHVEQTITPIKNKNDDIEKYMIIQKDITQEKLNNQVLDVLNRVLRHNLRSSINVIEGYTDMLSVDADSEQQKNAIETIQNRTESMNKISNKMTSIRSLIHGYEEPNSISIDSLRNTILPYQDMRNTNISMDIEYSGDKNIKYGNIFQIAFGEAINRAVVNNDKDISKVDIKIRQKEDNSLSVEIIDNKSNISESAWSIIKSGSETPLEHNDGIGLWLIYWSVTAMGGNIEISDNEPCGNVFKISVPLV